MFASYLIRLHTKNEMVNNYYLGQLVSSQDARAELSARYARHPVSNINAKNLERVLIPMPQGPEGLEEQRQIAAILEQADERVWAFGPVVKVAHLRLCHSRMPFVRAYPRESQEMVFDGHDRAFAFFKGTCTRGIYDNMKTAVDAVFVGKERAYNRRFLQMCGHYWWSRCLHRAPEV